MRFDNLTMRQLLYITTLANEQNFSKASEKLFMTQPSLSQMIKRIEAILGVTLFVRTKRQTTLTPEGQIVVRHAEKILKCVQKLEAELDINSQKQGETLTLGAGFTLGNLILVNKVNKYRQLYPHVKIELLESTSNNLEEYAFTGRTDLSFVLLPLNNTQLKKIDFSTGRLVVCMSCNNPLNRYACPIDGSNELYFDLEHANNASFIQFAEGSRIDFLRQISFSVARISPKNSMRVRNVASALELVSHSDDLIILPDLYATHYVSNSSNNINCYFIANDAPHWTLSVVFASDYDHLSDVSKNFIQYLVSV